MSRWRFRAESQSRRDAKTKTKLKTRNHKLETKNHPCLHRHYPCASIASRCNMVEQASTIRQTVLDNGLTIISERMDHVRSASVGIWVRSGSRHEAAQLNGISHSIAHTLFNGTRNRTSREIDVESDAIGGHVDAFTNPEVATHSLTVLDHPFPP